MTEYRFLTGPDDAGFCKRVTEHLNDGWELYGSPTMVLKDMVVIAGQAVTRTVTQKQGFCPSCDEKMD